MILTAANCVAAFERKQPSGLQLHMSAHASTAFLGFFVGSASALGHGGRVSLPVSLSPHLQSGPPVACPFPRFLSLSAADTPQEGPSGWGCGVGVGGVPGD